MSFQRLIVVGHVGSDPERKDTGTMTIARFSVAVSERRKDAEHTEWFRCTAFDRTAEIACEYVTKGSLVGVEGRLRTREYDKDGERKFATELLVDNLRLLGKRQQSDTGDATARPAQRQQPQRQPAKPAQTTRRSASEDGFDDDIPF
ncbi:MAG: single-stranded DNA-binding protein [Gemmatimonadaceae bacterium]|nr:single-stranded DNA-binding protein [Gemmatimonadaceae bacterium]